ncbi:MAG: hypothetical protein A2W28_05080 [Gammaproteobacteria bacterium RBG_16_51_14]|nr:MAG: hypothetical protein A2W28_05080 [Gammaproteobacteria bacterium RBG_16_51_14]
MPYYLVMKKLLRWIVNVPVSLALVVLFLPLLYILMLMILLCLPTVLLVVSIVEDREEYKVRTLREVAIRFCLIFMVVPLGILAFTAPMRSILVAECSFYPPALVALDEAHQWFYNLFIPWFGELFPFWLDFYWGIFGVCVIFALALMDSIRRNMLVTQIENLPTSTAHAAAIGLVELKGKAVPIDESHETPIIRSWMEETSDGSYTSRTSTTPFYLDDGTGRILVDPAGCKVDSRKLLFDINLHHAILGSHTSERGFPESRLMPGDEIYVLGNLQINDHHGTDKVIIKPKKSTWIQPEIYDLFFVSNTSEEELLAAFKKSIKRGWAGVFMLMVITGWLAVYAWTNITQIKYLELEAAPALFRLVTTPTNLERTFAVEGLGTHPTMHWIELLRKGHDNGHAIMQALEVQRLETLAVPILQEQALDIDHPAFGTASYWTQKLEAAPAGDWGFEYWGNEEEYVQKDQTMVFRVLLKYKKPQLFASYRAWFGKSSPGSLELTNRYVVFEFTNKKTGIVKQMEFFAREGWNNVDDVELFEHFLPGEYRFDIYAKRLYRGGLFDMGSRKQEAIDIQF